MRENRTHGSMRRREAWAPIVSDAGERDFRYRPKRRRPDRGLRHAPMAENESRAGQMQTAAVTTTGNETDWRRPDRGCRFRATGHLKRKSRGCAYRGDTVGHIGGICAQ